MDKLLILLLLFIATDIHSKTVSKTSLDYKVAVSDVIVNGRLHWTSTTQLNSGQLFEGDILVEDWITDSKLRGKAVPVYYWHDSELGTPPDFTDKFSTQSIWLLSRGNTLLETAKNVRGSLCENSYAVSAILPVAKLNDVREELEKYKLCLRFSVSLTGDEVNYLLRIEQRNRGMLDFPVCVRGETVGLSSQ